MKYILRSIKLEELQKIDILLRHGLMTKEDAEKALAESVDADGDGVEDTAYKPSFPV